MPDSFLSPTLTEAERTMRQKLATITDRFENRERLVNRAHALRWLRTDLDSLWREAQAEEFKLERYSDLVE